MSRDEMLMPEREGWVNQHTPVKGYHLRRYIRVRFGVLTHHQSPEAKVGWRLVLQDGVAGHSSIDEYVDVYTQERKYCFTCDNRSEREEWVKVFQASMRWRIDNLFKFEKLLRWTEDTELFVVRRLPLKETGQSFLMKVVDKRKLSEKEMVERISEVRVLTNESHSALMHAADVLEDQASIYIIMEHMYGSLTRVRYERGVSFPETAARDAAQTILSCLTQLHSKRIVHGALEPDHIVLRNKDDNLNDLKLCGLGAARFMKEIRISNFGRRAIDEKDDIFGVGITVFALIAGFLPYGEHSLRFVRAASRRRGVEYCYKEFKGVSALCRSFIDDTTDRNAELRPSAKDALMHPWIVGEVQASDDE